MAQTSDERAETHFRVAQEYYEAERFEDALSEFEEAYRLSPRPALLYNIGLAHERLGHWAQARDTYERFIDEAPDDAHVAAAQERLERSSRRAEAAERDGPDEHDVDDGDPTQASEDDAPTPARVWVGRILVEVGLASGIVSLATGIRAHRIHNDLEDTCPTGICSPDLGSRINKGQRLARTSTALTFVAAAAGIAGLVVLLTGGGDEDEEASEAPQLSIAPTQGGAYASGSISF